MYLKFIDEDENQLKIKLFKYDKSEQKEVDTRSGSYYINENFKFYIEDKYKTIRNFIKKSNDMFVIFIYFDEDEYGDIDKEGRIKKLYNPNIDFKDYYIKIQNLYQRQF